MRVSKLKPWVNKKYLYIISGLMWIVAGMMLMNFARVWLTECEGQNRWVFCLSGFLLALVIHRFGFLKVVDKNLGRIEPMNDKPCVFAFISWKSYLLIAVMITFGILLRHSLLPHQYLAIIYIGIGFGLFLSSIRYFRFYLRSTCRPVN
ncbi:MAG: hypothetical protein K8R35_11275 [Bacteroidales bacterium]|nr:hypothetical protein [Bacteroidales bacterium]